MAWLSLPRSIGPVLKFVKAFFIGLSVLLDKCAISNPATLSSLFLPVFAFVTVSALDVQMSALLSLGNTQGSQLDWLDTTFL
jgi:uncharacterized membrane protein YjjP (DUF1212 family)